MVTSIDKKIIYLEQEPVYTWQIAAAYLAAMQHQRLEVEYTLTDFHNFGATMIKHRYS